MFNLIITIIAIALVVVLTATSVFYGGDAFSEGSTDAIAATYINQAQQVQGAFTLFKAQTGAHAADVAALVDGNYLSSVPVVPAFHDDSDDSLDNLAVWALEGSNVATLSSVGTSNEGAISPEVCDKINDNGAGLVQCFYGAAAATADTIITGADVEFTDGTDVLAVVAMPR